jgi:hypothetical protein
MQRSRWVTRRMAVMIMIVLTVLAGPVGVMAKLQAGSDGPSPAQDHAQVIAQGVSAMPANQVAWRVVVDQAEPNEEAQPEERALGFALADEDAIVVNDLSDGSQTRLAAGEASFVGNGIVQHRASLSDQTVSYYRLALVPAESASDEGGDQLVFAGDGFAAPDGNRDLDLVRDVLQADEKTSIDDSGNPTLILVTAGELEIDTGSGEPETLGAGDAAEFSGTLDLTGALDGETAFVAAVIGPDVPAPPRFSGTIALGVYACEPGVTADDFDGASDPDSSGCAPVTENFDIDLVSGDDDIPLSQAENVDDGIYRWNFLPFGDYSLGEASTVPDGYTDLIFYDVNGEALESNDLSISRDNPDVRVNLFLFAPEVVTGSVTVRVSNCPPGMTPEQLTGDVCDPTTEGFDVTLELLTGDGQGDALALDDATEENGAYTWTDIDLSNVADGEARPLGIHEDTLPEGFESYIAVGPEGPLEFVEDAAGPAFYSFDLSVDSPSIEITIYNFQPGEETAGAVSMTAYVCPTPESSPDECLANTTTPITSVAITTPNDGTLSPETATADGDTLQWSELTSGTYSFSVDDITVDEGTVGQILGVTGGQDGQYTFELTADSPSVDIQVLVVGASEPEDVDTDSDGLTDDQEADLGTDPTSDDSDGDCTLDGDEVEAGTDPLDGTDAVSC